MDIYNNLKPNNLSKSNPITRLESRAPEIQLSAHLCSPVKLKLKGKHVQFWTASLRMNVRVSPERPRASKNFTQGQY